MISRNSIRYISLAKPITQTTIGESTTTEISNIQPSVELKPYRTLEHPEFKSINQSNNIIRINQPPSVPLYIKRKCLISIFGMSQVSNLQGVKSSFSILSIWKSIIFNNMRFQIYQRLISTSPFSVLVGSKRTESFTNLNLDGKTDWAILKTDAVRVYTGESLIMNYFKLPKYVSRRLRSGLNEKETGLFKWFKVGYLFISGRGQVGVTGTGAVYNITLSEEEEILLNRNNLLGITVNGPHDLQNCVVKYSFPKGEQEKENNVVVIKPVIVSSLTTYDQFIHGLKLSWYYIRYNYETVKSFLNKTLKKSYNYTLGNSDFVKVVGPRTLLIQSNTHRIKQNSNKIVTQFNDR